MASNTFYLSAWVTPASTNPNIGILPSESYVVRVQMHTTELWNSDGSDNIKVGNAEDDDAYAINTDVSGTGVHAVTLGSGVGRDGTSRTVDATYTNGGSSPSTGKTLVIIEYFLNRPQP
jgi:hypothetical protein